jgi:membrane associated rhomboid family serine protease
VSELPRKSQPRRVRRAPRFTAFLLTGGLAGLLTGLFLSAIGPVDARYDTSAAAGFLGLIFAGLGALAGGLVAVLLDRRT